MNPDRTVGAGRLILYALPAIPLAALTLPLYSFIPTYYAQTLGVPLAGIATALLFVRLFDAVNDPLFGWLADRWRPAFGRRRTVFIASVPVLMLGVWMVFVPGDAANASHLAVWTLVLSIGFSGCVLAYTAWGAELDAGYEGRTRIAGAREALTLVGTLLAITVPFMFGWSRTDEPNGFTVLATLIVIALPIFALAAISALPEPHEHRSATIDWREGWSRIARNGPFVRLASAFFLNGFGNSIAATLFLFFCSARLGLTEWRGPLLFAYFAAGILGVPLWTFVAARTSKHRAWCVAMVFAIAVFLPTPFLPAGSLIAFGVICVLTGLSLGADIALPPSMQADVIDVDTAQTGEQRSGLYFALWSLVTKLSLALAASSAFALLAATGFVATDEAASSTTGLATLAFLYGWGPIAFKIPAVALMWRFPLDREKLSSIRREIDARELSMEASR